MTPIEWLTTAFEPEFMQRALLSGLVASVATAALAGLLFGFDTAVISGATQALQERFALTDASLGFTVASALIGTVMTIGADIP